MEEISNLEKLFAPQGTLRSYIPKLLEHKLYLNRLIKLSEDWKIFKDILQEIGIVIGDVFVIYDSVRSFPNTDVENDGTNRQKRNGKEGLKSFTFLLKLLIDMKENPNRIKDMSEDIFKIGKIKFLLL